MPSTPVLLRERSGWSGDLAGKVGGVHLAGCSAPRG